MSNKNLLTSYLMPLAALVAALGVSTLNRQPIAAGATETSNLTIIDAKQENLSYLYVNEAPNKGYNRTIIGFNIPASEEVETINRLTIEVKYYTYAWWDVFKTIPIDNARSSIILSTQTYDLLTTFDQFSLTIQNVPRIGSPSSGDIPQAALGDKASYSIFDNVIVRQEKRQAEIDKFMAKDFYVILPYDYSYEQVFISIDAYTTGGDHISDGTNDGGFYEDEIGKYIDFGTTSSLVHFTASTQVSQIIISNFGGAGTLQVKFGNYDYQLETLIDLKGSYSFTGGMSLAININVPARYEAQVTSSAIPAYGNVRIYYDALTPAVSYNLTDEEGNPPDPVQTPEVPNWWDNFFEVDPDSRLGEFLRNLTLVVKIFLWIAFAFAAYNWVFIPTAKLFKRSKRR